jgi:DNA uptake protein ComE-like DNA-binding protein
VGQIDINQATVSQIASCLPRPGLAWPIFEHRMFQGPFRSLEEIASIPAMDSDALIKIKERFDVR